MGKGVLNAETAGVVGRDKDSHWEQPLPMVDRAKDRSSVTVLENVSLEPLERTFNDDLGLGRP